MPNVIIHGWPTRRNVLKNKNLMRHITLLLALIAATLTAAAQLTPSSVFTSAPADIFPLLDKNTRLDMVDYFTGGLDTPSANRLNGRSAITELTPSTLTVRISDSATSQIALLPAGADTIVALVTTVATPGLDSSVRFFTRDWAPLAGGDYLPAASWNDWITKGHKADEVTQFAPFMLASYVIDPSTLSLTANNNLSTFLDSEIYAMIAEALRQSITYSWNGKRYTLTSR